MDNKRKNSGKKAEDFSFQVDLRGIIHLLSENLYSSQDVFLRELLQNAVDAIRARRAQEADFKEGRIQITYHREAKGQVRLVFSDNGIGLGREEMHNFLSVIGQSSKRGNVERTGFIGQFGIGLLSCFLVTDEILFQSRSIREAQSYRWLGKSDGTYQVTEDLRKPENAIPQEIQTCAQPGTCVTLVLKDRMAERYGEEKVIELLREYGFLLRVPVEFEGDGGMRQINDSFIPWRQPFCSGEQILEFGQRMFGEEFFGVVPVVGEGLKGYAFISSRQMSPAYTGRHKIYLRDMLVTEDGKDLIPKWAFFTRCILNAQELTPMASREGFVSDHQLAKARNEIEKCIFNYFTDLARFDVKRLKQLTLIHNLAIKSLAVENEQVYKLFFPFLTFTTNKGKLTGFQIIETAKKLPVYYCAEADDYRRAAPLAGKDSLLINAAYNYDARLLQFLKRYYQKLRVEPLDEVRGTHTVLFHALAGDWSKTDKRLHLACEDDLGRAKGTETPLDSLYFALCWWRYFLLLERSGTKSVLLKLGEADDGVEKTRTWLCSEAAAYFERQADLLGDRMDRARKRFGYAKIKKSYEECVK